MQMFICGLHPLPSVNCMCMDARFSELGLPVIGQMEAYSFIPLWFCLFSLFFKQKIIHHFGTLLTVTMVFALICNAITFDSYHVSAFKHVRKLDSFECH